MKSYILAALVLVSTAAFAQQNEMMLTGSKKISKDLTPQQVIDSLHKRFPNAKAVQYYTVPEDAAAKGWTITQDDNLEGTGEVEYYTISFKQENLKYYGLYDKNGQLLRCKMEQHAVNLPEPVQASLKELKTKYPGYKLTSKSYYKDQNVSKNKEYYEVVAKNGDKKKTLIYSPDGTLLDEKD
jgi:hypothetical protein